MKKIISILSLVCICAIIAILKGSGPPDAKAGVIIRVLGDGAPTAWCSSCTGTTGADSGCFWHASDDCSTYSTSVGGTNVISEIAVPGTDPCAETGNALNIDINDNTEDAYWDYDPTGATYTSVYLYGWIRLTEENMNNNNEIDLFWGDDSTTFSSFTFKVKIGQIDATPSFRMEIDCFTDAPGFEEAYAGSFAINTWIKFEVNLPDGSPCQIRVDGGSWSSTTNNFNGTTRPGRYVRVGQDASARTGDLDLAYVHIDDDTLPSGCTEN